MIKEIFSDEKNLVKFMKIKINLKVICKIISFKYTYFRNKKNKRKMLFLIIKSEIF